MKKPIFRSLALTKGESFGVALRESILLEFGSNANFANAAGVSPGRITQIISGEQKPSPETLDWVLSTFKNWSLQERIHRAWMHEFAPLQEPVDISNVTDNIVDQMVRLTDAGNPRRAVELGRAARSQIARADPLWQKITEQILAGQNKLQQYGAAMRTIQEMLDRSDELGDIAGKATAHWMRGSTMRALKYRDTSKLVASNQTAMDHLIAWSPKSREDLLLYKNRQTALLRDQALNMLRVTNFKLKEDAYRAAMESVTRSMQILEDEQIDYVGIQTKVKIEIAAGHVFQAEELLEELAERDAVGGNHGVLTRLELEAKTHIARGDTEQAIRRLTKAAKHALDHDQLHIHAKIQTLLAEIYLDEQL